MVLLLVVSGILAVVLLPRGSSEGTTSGPTATSIPAGPTATSTPTVPAGFQQFSNGYYSIIYP